MKIKYPIFFVVSVLIFGNFSFAADSPNSPNSSSSGETYEQLKVFVDALDAVEKNYVVKPDTKKLIYGAVEGMMKQLDPFSEFLDPDENKEIKTDTEGEFEGIGLQLIMGPDGLSVVTPIPGTPAYKAGVLPDDKVTAINGKATKDWTFSDVSKELRGAPGTQVTLTIDRKGSTPDGAMVTKQLTMSRAIVKVGTVLSKMVVSAVGYLRITEFSIRTPDEVADALKSLTAQGAKDVIIDLRNNPGGALSAAVDVASLFLDDGKMIVSTLGRLPDSRQPFQVTGSPPYPDVPLIVLINGGSASAAEIVSGALQDNHRAFLLGSRSYGKASVQTIIQLSDGSALKLTEAHYYTPSGKLIQRDEKTGSGGITPDIEVSVSPDVEEKIYQQWDAEEMGKSSGFPQAMNVSDPVLERAVDLVKLRRIWSSWQGPQEHAP